MLYNGMEAGETTESGAPALFERLPVFWTIAERRPEFPKLYAQVLALRRSHTALQQGETVWIPNADPDRILTFYRRGGGEEFLVAVNCSSRPFFGTCNGSRSSPASFSRYSPVRSSHSCLTVSSAMAQGAGAGGIGYFVV